ncbi:MAG: selenocysteine-specific translation elongation factor [Gammaproteobacteria bacterium RBG_16_66_13]|nr:MAG: selenocysteine-specific translation elongation factor [Gammaproteobacteria bacterium RBG_16_66_13]
MIRVVGTAGHIDHGKSSLVQALTGMNPDRLREEQERQMTIDLGFAWMQLPDGTSIGFVDVPGHRDFIENMLAGVTGIDAALLVVAADEGIMPQTREHLAILDLLQVERALIVLTKIDLVDAEWLGLVEDDLRKALRTTRFATSAFVHVSSLTGEGLDDLTLALVELLAAVPARPDHGRPRLPIDRVFTMSGFGTVVTGTLADGRLAGGDEVVVLPAGRKARLRGLQTHRQRVDEAVPGSRVAANLSGVDVGDVHRGDVVAKVGTYHPSRRIDVQVRVLEDAVAAIDHQDSVKLYVGSAERMARVRLLEKPSLARGESGMAQLELDEPVVVDRGDRFILRRPTPGATLGGGVVLDPLPQRRHRRRDPAAVVRLRALDQGSQADLVLEAARQRNRSTIPEIARASGLDEGMAVAAAEGLVREGRLVVLGSGGLMERDRWMGLRARLLEALAVFHAEHPLRSGMPREELRSRAGLDSGDYGAVVSHLVIEGSVRELGAKVTLSSHVPQPGEPEKKKLAGLLERFAASPSSPPTLADCRETLGGELLAHALEQGLLVQISDEVVFRPSDYRDMVQAVVKRLEQGPATVAQIRDLLGSSRRYVLAVLEQLDREGVTLREGDERHLAQPRSKP